MSFGSSYEQAQELVVLSARRRGRSLNPPGPSEPRLLEDGTFRFEEDTVTVRVTEGM